MLIHLKNVLGSRDIEQVHSLLAQADFVDGKLSAGMAAAGQKNNQEVSAQQTDLLAQLNQTVMGNLVRHKHYQRAALPLKVASPFYASYQVGMAYGEHIDDPVMGEQPRYRSDLAITVFLNSPEDYDGGELEIQTPFGLQTIKLPAGDAILYPTHHIHHVKKITKGRRLAAVTWIESMVPDPQKREILNDLGEVAKTLIQSESAIETITKLEKGRLNLLRMWTNN